MHYGIIILIIVLTHYGTNATNKIVLMHNCTNVYIIVLKNFCINL